MEELKAKMTEGTEETNEGIALKLPFYVEKRTGLIFEAQIFDKFVLVRLATPGIETGLRKMSTTVFVEHFEEYEGDPNEVRRFLASCVDETPIVASRRY